MNLSAAQRCEALAGQIKDACDTCPGTTPDEIALAVGLWHAAQGLAARLLVELRALTRRRRELLDTLVVQG